jgi:hopanoid biosynthesis associated RND transporter like protein HpnN
MKIKRLSEDTITARALGWLARSVIRHRQLWFYPQLILCVACGFYTWQYLQTDMNQDNLVGANKSYHHNYLMFKKEFPTQDDLVVVVESDSPEKNRQFVERLGAKLDAETNLFHDVFYKGDLKMLGSKALLFVPESDLTQLQQTLQDYRPFLRQFTHTTNLVSLFNMVCTQFRTASDQRNDQNNSLIKALPALERIIVQARDSLRRPGTPPSPGVSAFFGSGDEAQSQIYVTFNDGRIFLVNAQAPSDELNAKAVVRLKQLVEETRIEVPGLNIGVTGEPVLDFDQMQQSQHDATVASVVALVLCAMIFIYAYQETGRPVKATFCLVIGLAYVLGFTTLTVGHLNILTVTFVPILIGLAIDYGVHLITRYEEELRHGRTKEAALTKAMVFTGQGILTGGFTTAGAFLAMWFTNFKGIQEMGIICGGGLLICLVPMLTLLPILLLSGRQNTIDGAKAGMPEKRARIENIWLQRPVWVAGLTIASCAVCLTQIPRVHFDYDLLHLQSKGLPAVEYAEKLVSATNSTTKSVLYGAVIATNLAEAVSLETQLTNLPAVAGVESIAGFLAEDQTQKLKIVGDIKRELSSVSFAPPDLGAVNLTDLSSTLFFLNGYLDQAINVVNTNDPALAAQLSSLRDSIQEIRKDMLAGGPAQLEANAEKLGEFQQALFEDVHDTFEALRTQDDSSPLRVADLPPAMRDRFVGVTGKLLLMVFPKKDPWQRENQKEFIGQVERIYPAVTGTPVQLYHYTELLKDSYETAAKYSLLAIVLLVLIHFRSPLAVALALVPVGVGFLWLTGLMAIFHISLNPANIMTLPLVIGIGVTNGIHVLNRFAEEQTPNILARSTGKAVLVSGLTAISGFGSLILGKHRGLRSLGIVMTIGLATCMVAGLTILPAILNLLERRNKRLKWTSADKKTTQCRQCTIDTGSGGTEVKDPECANRIVE